MNDNGNIRLLTPENDMRVRAFFSSLEDLSKRVEKICDSNKPSLDGERYYVDPTRSLVTGDTTGALIPEASLTSLGYVLDE